MMKNKIVVFFVLTVATLLSVFKIFSDTENNTRGSIEQISQYIDDRQNPQFFDMTTSYGVIDNFTHQTLTNIRKYRIDPAFFNANPRNEKIRMLSRAQLHYNHFQSGLDDIIIAIRDITTSTPQNQEIDEFMINLEEFITNTNDAYSLLANTVGMAITNNEDLLNTDAILINELIDNLMKTQKNISKLISIQVLGT